MGLRRASSNKPTPVIDLGDCGLDASDAQRLTTAVGGPVTYPKLDAFLSSKDASPRDLALARSVDMSLRGDTRKAKTASIGSDGVYDIKDTTVLGMRKVGKVDGEPQELRKLRTDLMDVGLWGQEKTVEDFVRLGKDHISPSRRNPAVLALCGGVAHGKDRALSVFAQSLFGEKGKVHTVQLAGVQDKDAGTLFDPEEGALGEKQLKALARKGAIVHLVDPTDLEQTAPKVAEGLKRLLVATRGNEGHHALCWAFDFNNPDTGPRELMSNAMGATGTSRLSATTTFANLDGPTMWRYAEELLPKLLDDHVDLQELRLEVSDEAKRVLGEALATPHAPLDELETRLHRLIVTHLDTQTSVDRDRAVLHVMVNPGLSEGAVRGIVQNLHTPKDADLIAAEDLVRVATIGKRVPSIEERNEMIAQIASCAEAFPTASEPLFEGLTDASELMVELQDAFDMAVWEFSLNTAEVMEKVSGRAENRIFDVIKPSEHGGIESARVALHEAINRYETEGLPVVDALVEEGDISPERRADIQEKLPQLRNIFDVVTRGLRELADLPPPAPVEAETAAS